MGVGARTHCDVVVKVEPSRRRILAIGGNVRGAVSLKLLPAAEGPDRSLRPLPGRRRLFAHLKLRAPSIPADALDHTPTMRAVRCTDGFPLPPQAAAARLVGPGPAAEARPTEYMPSRVPPPCKAAFVVV